MRNFTYLLIVTVLLTSCKNPLNKPIVEPLTVDELRSATKNDTAFTEFYEKIQGYRESFFNKDINQVKFGDISYKQLRKYTNYLNDSTFLNPIYSTATEDWKSQFGNYDHQLDSLTTFWKKYLEENSLNSYLKIEFDRINREYYTYTNSIKDVQIAFKLIPLKGTVQQVSFSYKIKTKIQSDEEDSIYSSIFDDKKGSCVTTSPFSRPVVRYWEVNYTLEKILKYTTSEDFKRDYDITFNISKIRVNDKNITEDDLLIPKVMKDYLDSEYGFLYGDEVIREFFNPDYISNWEYIEKEVQTELKNKDEKCYEFLKAVHEFEDE
ncbi:hypothetical protein [uncultured Salegentibacter sp.]|uniref:hypothetical protein n=1 Tax=uncultured Salegentibacter sp. TaxID=259320 RepID=UPI0025923993|nr:hypothetical protein [uncultured Salegentibacter sp.]